MKFERNQTYDIKFKVGTGKAQRIHKEKNVVFIGVVSSINANGNKTLEFRRTQQNVGQKETFAVSEGLLI